MSSSRACSEKKVVIFNIAKSSCPLPKKKCFCREKVSIVADDDCDTFWDTETTPNCNFIKGQAANGFYFVLPDGALTGLAPISGPGKRLMYHAFKSALRNGEVTGTQWDEANIGLGSFASGLNPIASGAYSTALGDADSTSQIIASGEAALAHGKAENSGKIQAGGDGSFVGGNVKSINSEISSSGKGSKSFGFADTGGKITSNSDGTTTFGVVNTSGQIFTGANGAEASGLASGQNAIIRANGAGSISKGTANGPNASLNASASGSFVFAAAFPNTSFSNSGAGSLLGGICSSSGESSNIGTSMFGTINFGRCLKTNNPNSAFFGRFAIAKTGTINPQINPPGPPFTNSIFGNGSLQLGGGINGAATSGVGLILGTNTFSNATPIAGGIANFWNSSGADYAEYFEWEDQNLFDEDRVGHFVCFGQDGGKIVLADNSEDVLGIVSAVPGVIGDSAELGWHKSLATDNFGRPYVYIDYRQTIRDLLSSYEISVPEELYEVDLDAILARMKETKNLASVEKNRVTSGKDVFDRIRAYLVENPDGLDFTKKEKEIGLFTIEKFDEVRPINISFNNSDFDDKKEYIPRSARKEWSQIGLLGKLYVYDNGECVVGKKCSVGHGGIAVPGSHYRVIERKAWNVIRVFFK